MSSEVSEDAELPEGLTMLRGASQEERVGLRELGWEGKDRVRSQLRCLAQALGWMGGVRSL